MGERKNGVEMGGWSGLPSREEDLGMEARDLAIGMSSELRGEGVGTTDRRKPDSLPDRTSPAGIDLRAEFDLATGFLGSVPGWSPLAPEDWHVREVVRVLVESIEDTELREDDSDMGGLVRSVLGGPDGRDEMEFADGFLDIARRSTDADVEEVDAILSSLLTSLGGGTRSFTSSFELGEAGGTGGTLSTTKHRASLLRP